MIPGGRHGEVGIPANRMRAIGWADPAAPCRPASPGNPSLTRVARSGARSCASQHGVGEIQQPGRGPGSAWETSAGAGRGPSAGITADRASQGWPDGGSAADRPAWPGRASRDRGGGATLPQPGDQGQQPEGRSKVSSMVPTVMTSYSMGWPV